MTPREAIPSASLILLREARRLEALMIIRAEKTPFAGGACVFPGGRIETSDYDADWRDRCSGYDGLAVKEAGARIAAIRETFEETGVLLALGVDDAPIDDAAAAQAVAMRARPLREILARLSARLDLRALSPFARWEPPEGATHRIYNTLFYLAAAPKAAAPVADGREAVSATWVAPSAPFEKGRKLIFPTRRHLERLAQFSRIIDARADALAHPVITITPRIDVVEGATIMTIPEDLGYPITRFTVDERDG